MCPHTHHSKKKNPPRPPKAPPAAGTFPGIGLGFLLAPLGLRYPLPERPQPSRRALRLHTSPHCDESRPPRLSEAFAFPCGPLSCRSQRPFDERNSGAPSSPCRRSGKLQAQNTAARELKMHSRRPPASKGLQRHPGVCPRRPWPRESQGSPACKGVGIEPWDQGRLPSL